MVSISSGLMSSKRDERVALPSVAAEFTLMPSTYTTGALPSESDDWPRMRMREPPPAAPAETICTPAAWPESSWPSEFADGLRRLGGDVDRSDRIRDLRLLLRARHRDDDFRRARTRPARASRRAVVVCPARHGDGGLLGLVADAVHLNHDGAGRHAANRVATVVSGLLRRAAWRRRGRWHRRPGFHWSHRSLVRRSFRSSPGRSRAPVAPTRPIAPIASAVHRRHAAGRVMSKRSGRSRPHRIADSPRLGEALADSARRTSAAGDALRFMLRSRWRRAMSDWCSECRANVPAVKQAVNAIGIV